MEKKYEHKLIEKKISQKWENAQAFKAEIDPNKEAYTIILPPPNANGKLHVGNALMIAIEDLLIRWKRMQGYSALWVPGTDHAGFETQAVFEKQLKKEGKSRFDFDRKTLYQMIYDFVQEKRHVIRDQVLSLGPSLDWSREAFTLDDKVINTVYDTFQKMYKDELLYRSDYIVNYCISCGTTLSDLETDHQESTDKLYYVRYPLLERGPKDPEFLVVATTRPEPIFVDTHLAINPKDKKKLALVGRKVANPLTDAPMEIIADFAVDPAFGTGILKLTPAHDKTDFEIALRHSLPIISAFDTTGKMLPTYEPLAGLYITKARTKALEILEEKGLIEKAEDYTHNLAVCYKCKRVIEPLVIPSWFVKVEELKTKAHEAVKNKEVTIFPKWQEIKYHRWMEEMRDWPISRQIAWGIRIPVWYNLEASGNIQIVFLDKNKEVVNTTVEQALQDYSFAEIEAGLQTLLAPAGSEFVISKTKPDGYFLQETDTFDTWFSSGHWPLVTLGYPDSDDFKYFYPTAVLETGWEILRFWVSRMIMFGIYLTGKPPFKDVYLHGLVRATDGRKMSKSLGNQVDPLDYVEQYGADALRMGLISGTANGKDFAFPHDKVIGYRNFTNKIWNMTRFMNMMFEQHQETGATVRQFSHDKDFAKLLNDSDKSLLLGLKKLIKLVDSHLGKYRFSEAGESIYEYMWHEIADKYIEEIKDREDKDVALSVLREVFTECLKLLHPFMPFVTEELWENIPGNEEAGLLVLAQWPKA